jgi:protein-tyrosine phosphatase
MGPLVLFLCSGNYYRSRFAELLFNHLAVGATLAIRADSAGLKPVCHLRNEGPISAHALAGLAARGIASPAQHRRPRDATSADFTAARVFVALKESEHRPLMQTYFPDWVERIRYWHIDDIDVTAPELMLPELEHLVRNLIAELAGERKG